MKTQKATYTSPGISIVKFSSQDVVVNLASSGDLVHPIEVSEHESGVGY